MIRATSVLARGNVDENTWFDEIDEHLERYARFVQRVKEPGIDAETVRMRYVLVQMEVRALMEHGVTVCGGIGHA
ncbi:hypothetical protein [Sphingomonas sp. BK345]|uniref:hypothetical protein n=1 Tax=Sphingomonas sp. BK345 TaxID=2586980 RepID=UPI001620DEB7|nr:hypothetical protein [Sphingomonas sp. BK345]MBB3475578.1 hypothetical protein [Sphingomonas sp. BK345]